jgi:hypothetical protein
MAETASAPPAEKDRRERTWEETVRDAVADIRATATGRPTPTGAGQRRRGNAPTQDTFLHVS